MPHGVARVPAAEPLKRHTSSRLPISNGKKGAEGLWLSAVQTVPQDPELSPEPRGYRFSWAEGTPDLAELECFREHSGEAVLKLSLLPSSASGRASPHNEGPK